MPAATTRRPTTTAAPPVTQQRAEHLRVRAPPRRAGRRDRACRRACSGAGEAEHVVRPVLGAAGLVARSHGVRPGPGALGSRRRGSALVGVDLPQRAQLRRRQPADLADPGGADRPHQPRRALARGGRRLHRRDRGRQPDQARPAAGADLPERRRLPQPAQVPHHDGLARHARRGRRGARGHGGRLVVRGAPVRAAPGRDLAPAPLLPPPAGRGAVPRGRGHRGARAARRRHAVQRPRQPVARAVRGR